MKLSRKFYNQPTLKVARKLLGKFLVYKIVNKKIIGMITETEAYIGPNDLASHASRGRTPHTEIMFGEPGYAYVYLIYGMYYCFNIVTEKKDYPAAVLIRGVEAVRGSQGLALGSDLSATSSRPSGARARRETLASRIRITGPGKVCQYMRIDKKLNGADLTGGKLWVEDRGVKVKKSAVKKGKRIGVDYAGKYKDKLWRFYIK